MAVHIWGSVWSPVGIPELRAPADMVLPECGTGTPRSQFLISLVAEMKVGRGDTFYRYAPASRARYVGVQWKLTQYSFFIFIGQLRGFRLTEMHHKM
jgi:hypothetical protein